MKPAIALVALALLIVVVTLQLTGGDETLDVRVTPGIASWRQPYTRR